MSQPSPRYRLHYFPESGNSYKLALMLTLCGQAFEPVWTDFGGGITRTAEWRARVNPMGEIPVLEDGPERLTQTAPILLRLADRYGRFGGRNEAEKFEILRWLFWDNHKLTGYMATYRYHRAFTAAPDPAVLGLPASSPGRFPGHPERPSAGAPVRDRRPADDRRYLADGLPLLPQARGWLRSCRRSSGGEWMAFPHGGASQLEVTLRSAAG